MPLARVETFCNSARFLHGEDAFGDVPSAREWLAAHGMAVRGMGEADLSRLVEAREAIRDHLGGETPDALNRYARRVLAGPEWTSEGQAVIRPRARGGADGLIGELLAILFMADLAGETTRLKPCRSGECRWIFYDRSPGRNSIWCSMEICGARHKMRAYRERRTAT